jgi:MOSC domain-containing protein YiiM
VAALKEASLMRGTNNADIGAFVNFGVCKVEVTQIGKECHHGCAIFRQVGKCIMPTEGIFVKVITEGTVRPADDVCVANSP